MNIDYDSKYLKYKQKYIELKKYEAQLIKEGKLNADGSLKTQAGGSKATPVISLYKAEWCGHCKTFAPVWNELQKKNKHIKFETYDSDKHKDIMKERKIEGFPSIHINGNNYNGARDFETLDRLLNNKN